MEKMRGIIDQLNTWAHAYYTLDAPLVDDKTYDALYDTLVAMEKETGNVAIDSPTRRVGGDLLDGFEKFTHEKPLYSWTRPKAMSASRPGAIACTRPAPMIRATWQS